MSLKHINLFLITLTLTALISAGVSPSARAETPGVVMHLQPSNLQPSTLQTSALPIVRDVRSRRVGQAWVHCMGHTGGGRAL